MRPSAVERRERCAVAAAEPGQAALDAHRVGHGPARRLDVPLVDRDAVDGAQDRGAHGVLFRGEQAGRVGEQADPVEVGDVEAVRAAGRDDAHLGLPGAHGRDQLGVEHAHALGVGRATVGSARTHPRRPVEPLAHGQGELVEQGGPPVGPRGGAGGRGVGLGEGQQHLEHLAVAVDGGHGGVDGGRVLVVAAGRQLDEGEVLAHEGHQHLDVARGEAPAG